MKNIFENSTLAEVSPIKLLLVPTLLTVFLWITSPFELSLIGAVVTYLLLFLSWFGYQRWITRKFEGLPAFALFCLVFWVYYGIPYFWAERRAVWLGGKDFSEESYALVMQMVLLGVLAFWAGSASKIGKLGLTRKYWDLRESSSSWHYVRLILVVTILLGLNTSGIYLIGEEGRAVIVQLTTTIPLIALILLVERIFEGAATRIDKGLVIIIVGYRLAMGLASGQMGDGVALFIVFAVLYVSHRKRVPWGVVATLLIFVFFFQVGKTDYRKRYWVEEEQSSSLERMSFWVENSWGKWGEAFDNPTGESIRGLMYESLARTSLIDQSANILEMTPAVVPYQQWTLYSYLLVTFVPRMVWPDKPSVNDSNRFYMRTYCFMSDDRMEKVSVSSGFLAEGYISFGWFGVILVMFLVGIFFNLYESLALQKALGRLPYAIGVSLLPYLLNAEAQMAQYIGGIAQHVFLTILVFAPIITLTKPARSETFALPGTSLSTES